MKKIRSFSVLYAAILSFFSLTSCDKFDEIFNDINPVNWPWHQEGDEEEKYKGEVLKFVNAEGSLTVEFGVEIGVNECTGDLGYEGWYGAYLKGDTQWLEYARGARITYKGKEYKSRIRVNDSGYRYAGSYWMSCNDGPYWESASGKYISNKYYLANGIEINLVKCTGKTSMLISIIGQDLNIKEAKVSQKK